MNIFVTDPCPVRSAQALDDVRVNKMITESLQMLGYAMVRHGVPTDFHPIKKDGVTPFALNAPHRNHPCTLWVGSTAGNFKWLIDHATALVEEHWRRGGKGQEQAMKNLIMAARTISYMPQKPLQEFENCSEMKGMGDICFAYRITLARKWEREIYQAQTSHLFNYCQDLFAKMGFFKDSAGIQTLTRVRRSSLPKWSNSNPPGWYKFMKEQKWSCISRTEG